MSIRIRLPAADGTLQSYRLKGALPIEPAAIPSFNRIAYSAAHVVADPRAAVDPWLQCALDWDATIGYRRHLWSLGLGVAEAMDTAQRGMGLDWPTSLELIRRSIDAARDVPGALLACGCGTDQLAPQDAATLDDVIRAYEEQMAAIEALGGRLIVMASRALARIARGPDDYQRVYGRLLSQARAPVILHWLGDMFDPALAGYWGSHDIPQAMATALGVIDAHAAKVDGIKISLLHKEHEITMRRHLPPGVRMYTGDDFNYPELIAGDAAGHSDALLGIFDAIAPAASAALGALAAGDAERFHAILAPTLPLSRHVFQAPTRFYKTGVVFMAWLNGHQSHFTMVGGQQSARSLLHFAELFRLADAAGLLIDPGLACRRMRTLLALHGMDDGPQLTSFAAPEGAQASLETARREA
ncbi:dihydrodipicolinate synthase family protein [Aquincola sp. S2]|uniref:Dihydrodipicolinate synthase family protein n=1 Tax=Pseudaquabacterium terrae TaxID=2732868 RepID=A0ABX2EMK4_9BURK|nr:dihydrodipicolinate synthase family protein [Aquabacterium terrae]NRF69891.1 dihydrodipicolinate synthase family protein [Aquabacterium terrae]